MTTIAIPIRFDPAQMIDNVVLVGAGGTGAQWARSLCRIIYDMKRRNMHAPTVCIVDPDRIEAKNVGRQLYLETEIGAYKAQTLAQRFSFSLGLEVAYFNEPFDAHKHASHGSLVCGAVDNPGARQAMAHHDGIWVDAGNHADGAAQVVIGNTSDRDRVWRSLNSTIQAFHCLPNAGLLFPALLQPELSEPQPMPAPTGASCADLVERGEQGLLANDLVASVAAQYCYLLLNRLPITTFVSFCDTLSVHSLPITVENVKAYLQA